MTKSVDNWATATVEELAGAAGIVSDGDWVESKDQDPNGEVRLIQLADVGDGIFLDKSSRFLTREKALSLNCTFLEPGDVLIARMPEPIGRACLFPDIGREAVTVVDVLIWRPGAYSADPKWMMHSINSPAIRAQIQAMAGGTTRQRVPGNKIKSLSLLVPPVKEQKQIAARTDEALSRIERAKNELNQIPTLIKRARSRLLVSAFDGELTQGWRQSRRERQDVADLIALTPPPVQPRGGREATTKVVEGRGAIAINDPRTPLPKGWAWVPLGRIARQETGHTPSRSKPEYWDGDIPWVGIRDAGKHHGDVIFETLQTITALGLENSSARILPAGTVCLSRTASVGYVTIMGRDMATSQDFATWTCSDAILPEYLMYALMSEGDDIRRFGEGTTHTTIYFPAIRAMHIKLAPIDEQKKIVDLLRSSMRQIDLAEKEHETAVRLLRSLRSSILAAASDGRLVESSSTEGSAEKWLSLLRQSRAVDRPRGVGRARNTRQQATAISQPKSDGRGNDMDKTRKDVSDNHLQQILGIAGGRMENEKLWRASGMNINEFYKQLRSELDKNLISQDKEKAVLSNANR